MFRDIAGDKGGRGDRDYDCKELQGAQHSRLRRLVDTMGSGMLCGIGGGCMCIAQDARFHLRSNGAGEYQDACRHTNPDPGTGAKRAEIARYGADSSSPIEQ